MRRSAGILFVLCLAVFLANGRPHPEIDCVAAPYMAWSLLRHGSYDLRAYPELEQYVGSPIRERADGAWVSIRPPGSALVMLPFEVPLVLLREQPLRDVQMHHLGKLAAAVSVATAAVFFLLICRRLAPAAAWPATILFALGTCLYSVASQALWMHGPAVMWLCCALYLLTCSDSDRSIYRLAAGLALGLAVLTRPNTAFFALATAGTLVAQSHWRGIPWLALGGVLPGLALLHYNWANFGYLFLGGYGDENWAGAPPFWLGLGGLLIAPSRGLLVYTPGLLLAFPGAWMLLRRREEPWQESRGILLAWVAASAITVVLFARWTDWRGGWCYGPRYLCETMPALCLLFAVAYAGVRQQWQRSLALGLVGLSVAIQAIGVFGYRGYEAWQWRHTLPDEGRCLFALHDTQIEAHAKALMKQLGRTALP
jgi:hypothetical protein